MSSPGTNIFSIAKKYKNPLILDGAMGSLLQQEGFPGKDSSWMTYVNTESPETIISIHEEYMNAGASIITTNTFRTNPLALGDISLSKDEVKKAVSLAKQAVKNEKIYIAGSNAPVEDCYQKERTLNYNELQKNHTYHIDFLIHSNVDFILNETQSHLDEIRIICEHCFANSIPYVVSLYIDENLNILSGEKVEDVVEFVWKQDALAVGINCISAEVFSKLMKNLNTENINFGFYLNSLEGSNKDSNIICSLSPSEYGKTVRNYLNLKPSFIGACCGSSPEHIKEIKKIIDG